MIVILNGRVILRRHERNPLEHKNIASYSAGGILGYDEGDDSLCRDCDVWVQVASKQIQYIEMEKSTFKKLWNLAQCPELQTRLSVIQQFEFVQRLSLTT